ncbi:MAG TPA: sugar ABC transporter substrate-binding protein, partial [Burkholderiales bacterium]|nr:sugar ABC transporter substrate-binding protein [Burkholderiales bacterium]
MNTPAHREPTFAVFTKNRLNPAYTAARMGADKVAARLGARTVHYVPEQPDHVGEQQALVMKAVAARPDACLFVATDAEAMIPYVQKLNAEDIPVFSFVNRLLGGEWVSFAGSDDRALAVRIANHLFAHIRQRGRVLVLAGTQGSVSGRDRLIGFADAFSAAPGIMRVADLPGEFLQDAARTVMMQFLATGTPFDAVLAANDAMALGVIEALSQAKKPLCPIVGVNAVPAAIDAIKAGTLLATASFDAMKMACLATEAAVRHLRGERVPREIMLPVEIVDRSN